jgi:hypothetical protein
MRDVDTRQFHRTVVDRLTFPEAAQHAYKIKNQRGYSWKIESIVKIGEES